MWLWLVFSAIGIGVAVSFVWESGYQLGMKDGRYLEWRKHQRELEEAERKP